MAEGARLESVFRLTPNEGSNPSLSASLNKKGPRKSVGLFYLVVEKEDMMRTLRFDKFAGSEFGRTLVRPRKGVGQDARNNPSVLLSRTQIRGLLGRGAATPGQGQHHGWCWQSLSGSQFGLM